MAKPPDSLVVSAPRRARASTRCGPFFGRRRTAGMPAVLGLAVLVGVCIWGVSADAAAQESVRLFSEPTSYTDVIDALDEGDPFDLNVSLGFRRSHRLGTIERERPAGSLTAAGPRHVDVAEFEHLRNTLELGLDVGIYHDLAFYARLPLVLSDTRSLSVPDDRSASAVNGDLTVTEPDGTAAPLFDMNGGFDAPTRSGIDALALGLAWAIFNQHRDPEYPTWVVMAEGRFSLGEPMHPCEDTGSGEDCLDGQEPGVSEGTIGLRLETRSSWRHRYVEPYAGLAFDIRFPAAADDQFRPGGDLSGFMNTLPPRRAEMTAGLAVIPWEHRGRWQRFVIDLRLEGAYISEGHGYSPLFDALGTSDSAYLRTPNNECLDPAFSAECRSVDFTGLTDMEAHGQVGAQLALEMQAAQYVRFELGAGVGYETAHDITYADACNPNVDPSATDTMRGRQGTCRNGIINPHHRPVIDLPGNRFRVDGALLLDFWATATAQF